MNIAVVIRLGGHIFHSVADCANYFNVPQMYVAHMLTSDNYPGCYMEYVINNGEFANYFQTLSVMKAIDVDPNNV